MLRCDAPPGQGSSEPRKLRPGGRRPGAGPSSGARARPAVRRSAWESTGLSAVGGAPVYRYSTKLAKFANFLQNFANYWRDRSRLYQNKIFQETMRLTAIFKLYKICILLHRCSLKIFAKNRFENSAISVKIQQNFANVVKFAKML